MPTDTTSQTEAENAAAKRRVWGPRLGERDDWERSGVLIALGALAAGGVGVWFGAEPWPFYGWSIMWTWPFILLVCLPIFVWAWRYPRPDISKGRTQRTVAHVCVALAGIATSFAFGARVWDAGQCWVGDQMAVRVDTVERDVTSSSRRSGGSTSDHYDITYTYEGQRYTGTSQDPVSPGSLVDVVRPGGPVCDSIGGPAPLLGFFGLIPGAVGAWWAGRLASTVRAGRRSEREDPIPGMQVLD
jgi:hypothetical protein